MSSAVHVTRSRRCLRCIETVHTARLQSEQSNLKSCLISASYLGRADLVNIILDHGISPETRDSGNGMSALDIARRYSHNEVAKVLRERIATECRK